MPRAARPGETNAALDFFVHGLSGYAAAQHGATLPGILVGAVIWELVENALKDALPGWFPAATGDSRNQVADVAAALVGAHLGGARWP